MANPAFHGRFLWQELRSRDPDAAAGFYTRVMPWKSQPFAPGVAYTVFVTDDGARMMAGATKLGDEASATGSRPQWVGSIGSNDVDATVAQAVALGARVIQPAADTPNVGRIALLADPQGGLFGVYKPAQEPHPGEAPLGGYSWHEFAAPDMEAGFDFYAALFGWQVLNRMDMGPLGTYLIYGREGKQEGGMYRIAPGKAQHTGWLPYASVKSADHAARAAVAAGGQIANGPMDVPGGRIAQLLDPQGVMFAVHSYGAPASAVPPAAKVAAKPAAKPAVKPAAKKAAKKRPAKKAARKAKPKVAAKAKRKPARKSAAKAKRKVARKPARKVARKAVRKVVSKSSRKAARKSARKPARKK
jgi:predicted enzyme related to lactoylglutathione lyase